MIIISSITMLTMTKKETTLTTSTMDIDTTMETNTMTKGNYPNKRKLP